MALTNYWWQLIWIFGLGGILSFLIPKRTELVLGKKEMRWTPIAAALLCFPFVLQAAQRVGGYGDTTSYANSFASMPTQLSEMPTFLETVTKDKGFTVFSCIIKSIIGERVVIYFFIIAAIQMACLCYFYRKYSCDFWLSLFIFVASTEYMSWFHNGIRQFLAIALILAATNLLVRKKYIPLIVVILIAATFHQSALIMIPIIFIVQGKAWNKKSILAIIACIAVLFFVDQFTDILDTMLSGTQYSSMVTDWTEWEDDGTNPLRVLVYSIPMILSLVGLKYIKKADDPLINIATNFSILTTGIALVSMVTSGIFIGRLIVYGSIYSSGILLPWEIKNMFTEGSSRLVKVVAVVSYVIFFYYQMHYTWGLL